MSWFYGNLITECIGNRLWELTEPLMYYSQLAAQTIVIPRGTKTDLLSTWGIPIISEMFDGDYSEEAALHDFLYSCHMFSRSMSDAILREALLAKGASRWKAWVIWAGVRLGGASHW